MQLVSVQSRLRLSRYSIMQCNVSLLTGLCLIIPGCHLTKAYFAKDDDAIVRTRSVLGLYLTSAVILTRSIILDHCTRETKIINEEVKTERKLQA